MICMIFYIVAAILIHTLLRPLIIMTLGYANRERGKFTLPMYINLL